MNSEARCGAAGSSAEVAVDRHRLLTDLVRRCALGWDPQADVRSAIRPDGMADVTVVSRRFENCDSREREGIFWPALDPVPRAEMVYFTYFLLLTPEEAARSFDEAAPQTESVAEDWDE